MRSHYMRLHIIVRFYVSLSKTGIGDLISQQLLVLMHQLKIIAKDDFRSAVFETCWTKTGYIRSFTLELTATT